MENTTGIKDQEYWIDAFGNEIRPGCFIVYGSGRATLSYGFAKEYTKNNKLRIVYPQVINAYVPPVGQGQAGRYEIRGWKTAMSSVGKYCNIAVVPFGSLKTFGLSGSLYFDAAQIEWRKLNDTLNNS